MPNYVKGRKEGNGTFSEVGGTEKKGRGLVPLKKFSSYALEGGGYQIPDQGEKR